MTMLEIKITDNSESFTFGGDVERIAKAICKISLHNEPFANALNRAIIEMNDDIEATEVRDSLIGMINNSK